MLCHTELPVPARVLPLRLQGTARFYAGRDESDTYTHKVSPRKDHPTPKPLKIIKSMIRNSTKKGGRVYDAFLGSGTTLLACEESGRICYGMELEPKYVDLSISRWEESTGRKAILIARK